MTSAGVDSSPPARRLLTICMPSYNRAPYIRAQVEFLCHFLGERRLGDEVAVIVANNGSTDDTLSVLQSLDYNSFSIHTHSEHYLTAEENMMRSLDLCDSEYVWFLGDDDPVSAETLDYALDQLRTGQHDCLIFNSRSIRGDGAIALKQPLRMNTPHIDLELGALVESIGFVYTFAGISNLFIRRDLLTSANGLKWLAAAPIYSHVAWFMDSLKGRKVRFCNSSIVSYRQNDYSDGHWDRMAVKLNVPSYFFWTMGLVILLENLARAGVITHANISNIFEPATEGNRYRLLNEIYFSIFRQMTRYAETIDDRERFSREDMQRLASFFLACDPTYFNLVRLIQDGADTLFAIRSQADARVYFDDFTARFHPAFNAWLADGLYRSRFVGCYYDYDVYVFSGRFVGVRNDLSADAALSVLDPLADGIDLVEGTSREEVAAAAMQAARAVRQASRTAAAAAPLTVRTEPAVQNTSGEAAALWAQIAAIKASTSWRITAPLRAVAMVFKRGS